MREFFAGVEGLPLDFESTDFTVFRFPSGDKLEVFGPGWQHFRAPDGKVFELVVDPAHP